MNVITGSRFFLAVVTVFTLCSCGTKYFSRSPEKPEEIVEDRIIQELDITVLHKADYNVDDSQTIKGFKALATDVDYRTELARFSIEVPRDIDFLQSRVLASAMGTQSSGGFAVSVIRAEEYTDKVVVTIELKSPGPTCVTTEALSNPYEFSVIQTIKPIEFIETAVVETCA